MCQISIDYQNGVGINKLAKKYNTSSWSIIKAIKSDGIPIRKPNKKKGTDAQLIELSKKFCDAEIARIVGASSTSVSARLRALGIKARPTSITNQQFDINPSCLQRLDSETGSYWFGFLLADGYLQKERNRLVCNLQYADFKHLQTLCYDLNTNKTPRQRVVKVGDKSYKRASIVINNQELCNFYKSAGWDKFKSGDPSELPDDIDFRHFLRGFWDGDGIITNSYKRLRMGICSQHTKILEWLTGKFPLPLAQWKLSPSNGIWYRWWGAADSEVIARYLYTNQTRALPRKVIKISKFLGW
jgi:hypothetical protein